MRRTPGMALTSPTSTFMSRWLPEKGDHEHIDRYYDLDIARQLQQVPCCGERGRKPRGERRPRCMCAPIRIQVGSGVHGLVRRCGRWGHSALRCSALPLKGREHGYVEDQRAQ